MRFPQFLRDISAVQTHHALLGLCAPRCRDPPPDSQIALQATPQFSALGHVAANHTNAFIADNATVNGNNAGAGNEQLVYVAAGSDSSHVGKAGVTSLAGVLASRRP